MASNLSFWLEANTLRPKLEQQSQITSVHRITSPPMNASPILYIHITNERYLDELRRPIAPPP